VSGDICIVNTAQLLSTQLHEGEVKLSTQAGVERTLNPSHGQAAPTLSLHGTLALGIITKDEKMLRSTDVKMYQFHLTIRLVSLWRTIKVLGTRAEKASDYMSIYIYIYLYRHW
jgi:hypothetical protein